MIWLRALLPHRYEASPDKEERLLTVLRGEEAHKQQMLPTGAIDGGGRVDEAVECEDL